MITNFTCQYSSNYGQPAVLSVYIICLGLAKQVNDYTLIMTVILVAGSSMPPCPSLLLVSHGLP